MSGTTVRVLLVGTNEAEFSAVKEHLLKLGCSCEFAQSCSHGGLSAAQGSFDVILCKADVKDFQAIFTAVLRPSGCVFRCFPVEDSCWWVPAVLTGKECVGVSALRPNEFAKMLDYLILLARGRFNAPNKFLAASV